MALVAVGAMTASAEEVADSVPDLYFDLDELFITAEKDIVTSDGTKLTYDLEEDPASKGLSVLDALRKVPMVSVDGQDNIYIKGDKNFRIYVNGKEDPMLTANASKVLKAMPAEAVSKIEVITEPGAKYDAEGTGGILNLITERKQRKDGYAGSVNLSASAQNFGASLYGRVKYGKVTADAGLNYANNDLQLQTSDSEQITIDSESAYMYRQVMKMKQSFSFNYIGANFNLSWEPSERDLLTFGADVNDIEAKVRNLDQTNSVFSRAGVLQFATSQIIRGSMKNLGANGNVSYRRTFDEDGHSLTTAYRFSFSRNPWNLRYANEVEEGEAEIPAFQRNFNSTYQREHTAAIDYVNPFGGGRHKLEAGAKGIFRRNSTLTSQWAGMAEDVMTPVEGDNGLTSQLQDVYALYASYSGSFAKFSLTAGLRYEHTYMGLDFSGQDRDNFRKHLNDITPDASMTYMFSPACNLRVAYQMRISRPSITQMNPMEFKLTQTMVRVGNPDLSSERYNKVSLSYSNFGRVLGGNIALTYSQSDNTIESFTYIRDGVNYETYGNFGHNRKAELSGFLNWNISRSITLSVNGGINYTSIHSADRTLGNHGWKGNYGGNFDYKGPWKMKFNLYGGQSTGNITLQGKDSGWYYYGLGVSRSFLKEDSLTLALNANNFLAKHTTYRSTTIAGSHIVDSTWRNRSWNVGLSLTWNFGHLSDQVKKTGADLDNNDSKSSGSKTIGL